MMILNIIDEIQKIADKFRDWLVNSNSWVMLGFFFGFFFIFVIGWNIIHKHD